MSGDQLFPELFWVDLVGSLPSGTMAALATEAAHRGTSALDLAKELMQRYENDPDCKRRIDCAATKILEAAIKKENFSHLVPRDVEDALLIQILMQAERKKRWPGVGKVVMKSIAPDNVFTIVRS
jgi:hypothetical protein